MSHNYSRIIIFLYSYAKFLNLWRDKNKKKEHGAGVCEGRLYINKKYLID